MSPAADKFHSIVSLARSRTFKEIRSNLLVALLTAVLLYFIPWTALRPGLALIAIGRLAGAFVLWNRNRTYANTLSRARQSPAAEGWMLPWFDNEERFLKRVKFLYAGSMIGFAVLAYGFWLQTGNLWIALALGVAYPASVAFGAWHLNDVREIGALRRQKSQFLQLLPES